MTENRLPKHIADLCGILESTPATYGRATLPRCHVPRSPLATRDNGDGSFTVTYFEREIGHMAPAKMAGRDATHWIATSLHGDVKRCFSETHARNWIIEQSH
jgi:hypothetical protein